MEKIVPMCMFGYHFNIVDNQKYAAAMQLLKESLFDKGATMFAADNVIVWNRNLSFLRDPFFRKIIDDDKYNNIEKSLIWRNYTLIYFAGIAAHAKGDFMELGCYTGFTASRVMEKIPFRDLQKLYYLYDLFEWKEGDQHTHLEALDNPNMYEQVKERFRDHPYVIVTKGSVPNSFSEALPEKIAFAHIDMNHPSPEVGALEIVLPRLSHGGVVILDDYGRWGYSAQKIAMDPIIAKNGFNILELPTGQGVIMRPFVEDTKVSDCSL